MNGVRPSELLPLIAFCSAAAAHAGAAAGGRGAGQADQEVRPLGGACLLCLLCLLCTFGVLVLAVHSWMEASEGRPSLVGLPKPVLSRPAHAMPPTLPRLLP